MRIIKPRELKDWNDVLRSTVNEQVAQFNSYSDMEL
jgi:hypothetical protein